MAGKLQVDSDGFRKRVAWRGPFGALSELISNALDERITRCDVSFSHVSQQTYLIRVEDDSPDGFRNLEESYTLYADSYKANTPSLRGRFNVGEKVGHHPLRRSPHRVHHRDDHLQEERREPFAQASGAWHRVRGDHPLHP
jgi:hypothetical protein